MRKDIEIIIRQSSTTVLSKSNQITFSKTGHLIALFTTAPFSTSMLDELESSKIVQVEEYNRDENTGTIKLMEKFGYSNEVFTDVITNVFIKYDL